MAPCSVPLPTGASDPAVRRRAFAVLFMIELWERFGFYGMAALMVLYMVEHLGYTDQRANVTWGVTTALVLGAPALGGWVGDRFLGARRAMLLGAVVLAAGYLLLSLPHAAAPMLFPALALVAAGNGLFKPNAGNLVRRIYQDDPARIDSAFTLYYMAVNVGSTASMLGTPWLKDRFGWHVAFAACCAGLLLGLLNYALMRRALERGGYRADLRRVTPALAIAGLGVLACALALAVWMLRDARVARVGMLCAGVVLVLACAAHALRCNAGERRGLAVALVLTLQTGLFFVFYQQMSTSLTLFALRNVEPRLELFGVVLFTLQPAQFQALNPIWIMALSPPLAWCYMRMAHARGDLEIATKFVLGFVAAALGFGLFAASGVVAVQGRVSPWFMVGGYGLYSLGELLTSGLGLAMLTRYAPARMSGFMIGVYYASLGMAGYVGSLVANLARLPHPDMPAQASLPVYQSLFARLSVLALLGALVSAVLLPWMRSLTAGRAPARSS